MLAPTSLPTVSGSRISSILQRKNYSSQSRRGLNRPQLPSDVVGDAPEIANIGLPDEGIGAAQVAPVQQVDVLPAFDRRRQIGLLRGGNDQRHRAERLVVGNIDELRRRPPIDDNESGAVQDQPPRLQIG